MRNVISGFAGLFGGSQHLSRHSGAFFRNGPEVRQEDVYNHTALNTPVLVRSRNLSPNTARPRTTTEWLGGSTHSTPIAGHSTLRTPDHFEPPVLPPRIPSPVRRPH